MSLYTQTGSSLGIMYDPPKVHKVSETIRQPPFRPILSAIWTPTYNLCKYLTPRFNTIINNEYTIKNSFSFANEIIDYDGNYKMSSLDVDSLFTNIPLN